jgi:type I restriction enzyme S subunit
MQNDCFPEATRNWPKLPISALAIQNPRYPVKKGKVYPFIEMASVGENFGGILKVESRAMEGSGLSRFRVNDTLFAKITPCPENGKIAFVKSLPGPIGIGSTEFIVLSPRNGSSPRFLFHLLCSDAVRGRAAARMEGSTGRQRVPDDVFDRSLLVVVPNPTEQAAIADTLDAVDTAIESTRRSLFEVNLLQRALIEDAFRRVRTVKRTLRDFATDVRYGTSQASSERGWGNPVLRIPNVVGDQLTLNDLAYVDLRPVDVERLSLSDGDLLLVRTNGNPNYVGRSAVFRAPDERTWVYASYLIRVRLSAEILPDYVNVFLSSELGRRELLRRVTTSAGNHNINSNSIRLLSIPVPDDKDNQQEVVDIANASRAKVEALSKKVQALEAVKKSLMHDLLTGVVHVDTSLIEETQLS